MVLQSPNHTNRDADAALRCALARVWFLDYTGSDQALAAWRDALVRYPDSLPVYRAALGAKAVKKDRGLMRQVIERLRTLAGEDALSWRLAKGQWLIDQEHPTHDQLVEASLLLGEVQRRAPHAVMPRLWMARAFRQMGEPKVAVAQLRRAAADAPHHQAVLLDLSQLLVEQGELVEARQLLDRVVANAVSTAPQLQQAAVLLVRLGAWDAAAAALRRTGTVPQELLMAGLADDEPTATEDEPPIAPSEQPNLMPLQP